MKTSRVSRVIQILMALQSGQSYKVEDLAKLLGVSRRMVFRDLSELRKVGVPCNFDKNAHCYAIASGFFLPAPNLNTQEALGLLLLAHKARNCIHFPFNNSTLRAALKIANDLPEQTRRFCNTALGKISIKAGPQEEADWLDQKFIQLLNAILKKQVVNIRYYSTPEENMVTNLSPYHLMYDHHA